MVRKIIGACAAGLVFAAGPALAQGPGAAPATPAVQLVPPSGVGGCIYRSLPESVSRDAVAAIMSHGDFRSILRGPTAAVAPRCTGRPYSDSDGAVVGSVFSAYSRMIAA